MLTKRLVQKQLIDPFDIISPVFRRQPFFSDLFQNELRPRYHIQEQDNTYNIEVEVPGFTKDQIEIEHRDNVLKIRAQVNDTADNNTLKRSLEQSFSVPSDAASDSIKASLENGILKMVMEKKQEQKGTKVMIE